MKEAISCKVHRVLCWQTIVEELESTITLPDIVDFKDIRNEILIAREARKLERQKTAERFDAAKRFVSDRRKTSAVLPTCFEILGFKRLPTLAMLRQRFLQLARETHPDLNPNELKNEFKQYREAYEQAVAYLES